MDVVYQLIAKGTYGICYYDYEVWTDAAEALASCQRMNAHKDKSPSTHWEVITLTVR